MRLIDADELKKAITKETYNFKQIPIRVDEVMRIIDNAPSIEPRIEYGTDGQPYRLFMSGGQVVPDTLQGWRYEGETNDQSIL